MAGISEDLGLYGIITVNTHKSHGNLFSLYTQVGCLPGDVLSVLSPAAQQGNFPSFQPDGFAGSNAALMPAAFGKGDGGTGFVGKCTSDVDGRLAADVPME